MKDFTINNGARDVGWFLKSIKGAAFKFDDTKYLTLSLVDLDANLSKMYQRRTMSNATYYEQFMGIVNVIKHYGGSVGAHPILIEVELTNISNEGISTGDTKET